MDANGIIPDIIDVAPKEIAEVIFPSGAKAELGNELTPTLVKDQPKVTWNAEEGALYTLFMVAPDVPSRENPLYREVILGAAINIPGNKLCEGQVIMEYTGIAPQKDTGMHRYIVLVFKQAEAITTSLFVSRTSIEKRYKVATRDYIAKYNLGAPIAGNYFVAQYDEYSDVLGEIVKAEMAKLQQ